MSEGDLKYLHGKYKNTENCIIRFDSDPESETEEHIISGEARRSIEAIADHESTKGEDDPVREESSHGDSTEQAKLRMVVRDSKKRLFEIPGHTVRPSDKDPLSPGPSEDLLEYLHGKFKRSNDGIFRFNSDEDSETDEPLLTAEQIGSIDNREQEETVDRDKEATYHPGSVADSNSDYAESADEEPVKDLRKRDFTNRTNRGKKRGRKNPKKRGAETQT